MEEVLKALKAIKEELDEQRVEIRETGKNVTEQVTHNITSIVEEKFLAWEHKHEKLKEIVENQERRIYFLEKQERKRNLVFFGIEETETSYNSLEENLIEWVDHYFSIKLTYSDVQEVRRIGKKSEKSERPRPLVVIFSTLGTKIKIMKQKGKLKDTNYYFKEDYPKQVLEKRKELQEQAKIEREKGNLVKIKYDKLVIIKPNQKRQLHTSPTVNLPQNSEAYTQVNKKKKTQRSNSVSEGVLKPSMLNFLVNKHTKPTTLGKDIENSNKNA